MWNKDQLILSGNGCNILTSPESISQIIRSLSSQSTDSSLPRPQPRLISSRPISHTAHIHTCKYGYWTYSDESQTINTFSETTNRKWNTDGTFLRGVWRSACVELNHRQVAGRLNAHIDAISCSDAIHIVCNYITFLTGTYQLLFMPSPPTGIMHCCSPSIPSICPMPLAQHQCILVLPYISHYVSAKPLTDVTCSCFCFNISCCMRLSSSTFRCEQ